MAADSLLLPAVKPPGEVVAKDTPNDAGSSIMITWKLSPDDIGGMPGFIGYDILRGLSSDGPFEKIGETTGWLGTAYFRTGEYDKATKLLEGLTRKYPDQIGLTLRAYGNLVKYSRENRKTGDLERHIKDVQRYAESLIRDGKDQEYPLLYKRVSQIMTMGGYPAEAREWAQAAEQ